MAEKILKSLLLTFGVIVIAIPLSIIALVSFLNRSQSVSFEPKYSEIYNQTFELQDDLFVCQWSDTKQIYLQTYSENQIGIIRKGTKLRVKGIEKHNKIFVGINVRIFVDIDDPLFSSYKAIDASNLIIGYLRLGYNDDLAQFDPQYLKNTEIRTLHIAVQYEDFEAVKKLVESGADLNQTNLDRKTPLHYAKQLDMVQYLLEKGADSKLKDKFDKTLLHYAVKDNNIDVIKLLIKNGVNIDQKDNEGNTPLLVAARDRNFDVVVLLLKSGADASIKGEYEDTVLLLAAQNDRLDIVQLSLESGADPLAVSGLSQMNGILFAARNDNIEMAKFFVAAGVPLDSANHNGRTPLHYASGNVDMLAFLIGSGADVHQQDERGRTVLHEACYSDHLDSIQFLCEKGAQINQGDNEGVTPFLQAMGAASRRKNFESLSWLIKHGADVCLADHKGRTALHYAGLYDVKPEVVKLLLTYGACASQVDNDGMTPLQLAEKYKSSEAIRVLRSTSL